jgi:CRISP-associated protein Cas1
MSWRTIVISSCAKLDYQMGFLVIRRDTVTKVHLSEIHTLMVESTAVSLTAALLQELVNHKIKVIFCDEKRNPNSELIPYYGAHDTSRKVRNQIAWTEDIKTAVWTEIVSEKIRNQMAVLEDQGHIESKLLQQYIEELQFGDESNREGHAAKVYFNALFGKDFSRSSDNSTNAALNYGYSIILSCFTREIALNGYLTQLGLFHDNMFNQFNLASDLMEPFRTLVDRKVLEMKPEKLEHEEKMLLVGIVNQEVQINGRREYVSNAIKIYTRSIFDAIEEKDVSLIRFYTLE